jgi:predicted GIY-YIG superfamily endonuclease
MAAWVYLVRCRDGSLYCGWSTDPQARTRTHNAGTGAAYTRSRRPVTLVYYEACPDRIAAMRREYALKRLTRRKKLALVEGFVSPPRSPA